MREGMLRLACTLRLARGNVNTWVLGRRRHPPRIATSYSKPAVSAFPIKGTCMRGRGYLEENLLFQVRSPVHKSSEYQVGE
jgi:hypothetical protein